MVDLLDAATTHAAKSAIAMLDINGAGMARLQRKDKIRGIFGQNGLGRGVPAK